MKGLYILSSERHPVYVSSLTTEPKKSLLLTPSRKHNTEVLYMLVATALDTLKSSEIK